MTWEELVKHFRSHPLFPEQKWLDNDVVFIEHVEHKATQWERISQDALSPREIEVVKLLPNIREYLV